MPNPRSDKDPTERLENIEKWIWGMNGSDVPSADKTMAIVRENMKEITEKLNFIYYAVWGILSAVIVSGLTWFMFGLLPDIVKRSQAPALHYASLVPVSQAGPVGAIVSNPLGLAAVIVMIGFLIETLTEAVFGKMFDHYAPAAKWTLSYIPVLFGVGLSFYYQFDMLALVGTFLGVSIDVAWPGMLITGVALGQGSTYLHDFFQRFLVKPAAQLRE